MSGPRRLSGLSLRTQLLALTLAVVGLLVLVTAIASTAVLRTYLVDRIDTQLAQSLRTLDGPRRPGGRPGPVRDVAVTTLRYDAAGTLQRPDARRLLVQGGPEIDNAADLPATPVSLPGTAGEGRWRVLASDTDRNGGRTVVAVSLDGVRDTSSRLLLIDATIGLVALVGAGLVVLFAVRRSLAPLVAVEQTAEAIAAGDLTRRVDGGDPRTEVGSLAASFNAMVERFESAYTAQQQSESAARASEERMRRFVGDASHELRTPLTSIRGFAELFRQGAASEPDQLARVMRRIEDEAARMGLLVEDLLLLARLDQQRPLRHEPVDLLALAADAVHDATAAHPAHSVQLAPSIGTEPTVLGDDARLRQVIGNLVTNAVVHTPAGSRVGVGVEVRDGEVLLRVSDDGPGMTPGVADRVFERFYRADTSRTRGSGAPGGAGLGLSIVAALVAAHDGAVRVQSSPGRGTTFEVALPAASKMPGAEPVS